MRKIAAHYVFPISSPPIKNGIITVDDRGVILDIKDGGSVFKETAGVEFFNGILVPGFVNSHCHLELSHLKGKITPQKGLAQFIIELLALRNHDSTSHELAAFDADQEMLANGIVACADICNTAITLDVKSNSKIYYHNFAECYGLDPLEAVKRYVDACKLSDRFRRENLSSSVTAHASYSISPILLERIVNYCSFEKTPLSIHNQEAESENELFETGHGRIKDMLLKTGAKPEQLPTTGMRSLPTLIPFFRNMSHLMLVHNTFTSEEDIAELKRQEIPATFVVCPNSNLFIEKKIPDIELFMRQELPIAIGTDGLSSNSCLSILDEMKTISQHFRRIALETMLNWATLNGAKALGIDHNFGSFEKGKKPGINLIAHMDLQSMKLREESFVKRLA